MADLAGFAVYPSSVRVLRFARNIPSGPSRGNRAAISSFSESARRNLKFKSANAFPQLISQFCLTYHDNYCQGPEIKAHLHQFLVEMRKKYSDVAYIWVLEFQSRKFPHFHLFLNIPKTDENFQSWASSAWNRITEEGEIHLWWHNRPENFISWDMGSGSYLTKYLDKTYQKAVPAGYESPGRFWGTSRGLVPPPVMVESCNIDEDLGQQKIDHRTGEVTLTRASHFILRVLAKYHQKKLDKFGAKSRVRSSSTNYTLSCASRVFWDTYKYIYSMARNFYEPQPFAGAAIL